MSNFSSLKKNSSSAILITHIVGARPQFIKMAAVSRAICKHNKQAGQYTLIDESIVHTGQHYDYKMSNVFFDELHIPRPHFDLKVGSASHGKQTGEMLARVEQVLLENRPTMVLVYGDTNSTLAAALAAIKLHIPVAHIEAGLRSHTKSMAEEVNRVLTDHVSAISFCPTETAVINLQREGFSNIVKEGKLIPLGGTNISYSFDNPLVVNVGDVMFDSILYNLQLSEEKSTILQDLHLEGKNFFLATVHRAKNTDDSKRLEQIFSAFQKIAAQGIELICPIHPRTKGVLKSLEMKDSPVNLKLIEPISYLDMLMLEKNANLILTDSGGVQKESFIWGVPCVTLRKETEWVETVDAGWNLLTGANEGAILRAVEHFHSRKSGHPPITPYGDGRAAERIVELSCHLHRKNG